MSFSLYAVFAEQSRKTFRQQIALLPERMLLQSTGELGAQVALLQSPILPVAEPV
jgi:hypothetical protein